MEVVPLFPPWVVHFVLSSQGGSVTPNMSGFVSQLAGKTQKNPQCWHEAEVSFFRNLRTCLAVDYWTRAVLSTDKILIHPLTVFLMVFLRFSSADAFFQKIQEVKEKHFRLLEPQTIIEVSCLQVASSSPVSSPLGYANANLSSFSCPHFNNDTN